MNAIAFPIAALALTVCGSPIVEATDLSVNRSEILPSGQRLQLPPGVEELRVRNPLRIPTALGFAGAPEIIPIRIDRERDSGSDWNNFGGNSERNGRTDVVGPTTDDLLWSNTDDFSIISWQPVTLDGRVFAIRESGFPQAGGPANDKLVAYDLETGAELWSQVVPYAGDPDEEWIAYIGGANDGKVYCARGGSGRTAPIYAYDAATGAIVWTSTYETVAGPYDGIVFASNGDLLVGDFDNIVRIDATDGSTVWSTPRLCPVSGTCGCAASEGAVYIHSQAPGGQGQTIARVNIDTGAIEYESPIMPAGIIAQNMPFVSADGSTVYFSRASNSPPFDNLHAFADDGTQFTELWDREVRWTTRHVFGLADDGSIYAFLPGDEFARLSPTDGSVVDTAGALSPVADSLGPMTAISADGTVYISNGFASSPATNGRIWAFNADLSTNLFTLNLDRQNTGGPVLAENGALIVADRTGVYAYRAPAPPCPEDLTDDGVVDTGDLFLLLGAWGPCPGCPEDLTGDDVIDTGDLFQLLGAWGPC